jgi:hypothetical protein
MGNSGCNHDKAVYNVVDTIAGVLSSTEIAIRDCPDCGTKRRCKRRIGGLTGWPSAWEWTTYPGRCKHSFYKVDESTCEVRQKTDFGGSLLRLFAGPAVDGIQHSYFQAAIATCRECEFKFWVESNYKNQLRDGGTRKEAVQTSAWKPMTTTVDVIVRKDTILAA